MQNDKDTKDMQKMLSIGEASDYLGISIDTLRRWEKKDKVKPHRSPGGHRYFKKEELDNLFGRKYERAKELKPRSKKKAEIKKDEPISKPEKPIKKAPDIRVISEREPRDVQIPVTKPISIISDKTKPQTKAVEYNTQQSNIAIQHNVEQTTTAPYPFQPPPSLPKSQISNDQRQKGILETPQIKSPTLQKTRSSKRRLERKYILYVLLVFIVVLIITFTIFVILSINREVLSPIP